MKRFLASVVLLILVSSSIGAATNFNVWQPKGIGPANPTSNHLGNPSVIPRASGCVVISSPCFGMWAGADAGNPNPGVYYFESTDGLTGWTAYTLNPVTLAGGSAIFPTVFLESGTFFLYAGSSGGSQIDVWTSTDGVTWLIQNGGSAILTPGAGGSWDQSGVFQINICDIVAGTWFAYYVGFNSSGGNNKYQQGLITSSNGITWTKSVSNPLIDGVGGHAIGATTFYNVGGSYYAYASGQYQNAQLETNQFEAFYRWSSPGPSGPWTELVNGSGVPIAIYYPTALDFAVTANSGNNNQITTQVGDPRLVSANGNIYLYYTLSFLNGSELQVNQAEIPSTTLTQLVATNEGVLNVPRSGIPFDNLITQASDNFSGPNANPIGGNWTTMANTGNFGPVQRVSNQLQNSSTSTPEGTAYWNPLTWNNDSWSMSTVAVSIVQDWGAAARESTGGIRTCYNFFWMGTLGGSGSWFIQKVVSGTATNLQTGTGLTMNVGDTIMGAAIGTNILYYWNGFLIAAVSDSSISSGSSGVMFFSSTANANEIISAWSGGTTVGNLPFIPSITPIVVSSNSKPQQVAP